MLENKGVFFRYNNVIKDMYNRVTLSIRIIGANSSKSKIIGLYQESILNPYLFLLVMNELSKHILDDIFEHVLFVDDILSR